VCDGEVGYGEAVVQFRMLHNSALEFVEKRWNCPFRVIDRKLAQWHSYKEARSGG
jgi:hypothetical protein